MKGQSGLYGVSLSSVGGGGSLGSVGAAWALQGNSVLRTNSNNNMKSSQLATYTSRFSSRHPAISFFFSLHSQGLEKGRKSPPNRVSTVSACLSH